MASEKTLSPFSLTLISTNQSQLLCKKSKHLTLIAIIISNSLLLKKALDCNLQYLFSLDVKMTDLPTSLGGEIASVGHLLP